MHARDSGVLSQSTYSLSQWRRQVLQVEGTNIWGSVDEGTEGPGAEVGWGGSGEGRRSPSPVWAPEKFSKNRR